MSNKDEKPDKSGFSLQGEIKKRKTQEMQRTIEQKRIAEARGETFPKADPRRTSQTTKAVPSGSDPRRASQTTNAAPPSADPRRTSQTSGAVSSTNDPKRSSQTMNAAPYADPRRSSQTMPPVLPTADPRRKSQTASAVPDPRRTSQATSVASRITQSVPLPPSYSRRNLGIAAGATILAVVILVGSFFLAGKTANSTAMQPTTTLVALPMVSVNDVVNYLKNASVPITDFRQLPVDTASWSANQEVQFDIQRNGNKGTFIVLSYTNRDRAVDDQMVAMGSVRFKGWQVSLMSNVLLLTSPDAPLDIRSEIGSHMTSYLLAPYRPFLPTATPQPSPTGQTATGSS